jgi:hypothetical protein
MYYAYHNHIDFIPKALKARYPYHAVYGGLAIFGESIENITGIALNPEQINSYVNTESDENYMAQLADEADQEQVRIDAREALREALQLILTAPDGREIRVNSSQAHTLYSDWLLLQPDQETNGV